MFKEEQGQKECEHQKIFLYKNLEMHRIHKEAVQVSRMRADRLREKSIADRSKASIMEEIDISHKQWW